MPVPCDNCDLLELCDQIRRCFRAGLETDTFEGELIDDGLNDINEEGRLRKVKMEEPKELNDWHRQFLQDVIFL